MAHGIHWDGRAQVLRTSLCLAALMSAGAACDVRLDAGSTGAGSSRDRTGFVLAGNARETADGVELTPANTKAALGGLVQAESISLLGPSEFHLSFEFFIFSDQASAGDGLALVLHADPRGAATLGTAGGGMGYEGLAPCVAIEADTFQQVSQDLMAPHFAILPSCRALEHAENVSPLAANPVNGGLWLFEADYVASTTTLTARLGPSDLHVPAVMLSKQIDLAAQIGPLGYVAITASGGEATSQHVLTRVNLTATGLGSRGW